MLGDQTYPSQDERQTPREVLLDELRQAMEVLPAVVAEIEQYTDDSLLMYANRIVLATCVLHNIERKLNEGYQSAQAEGRDDDEGDEEDMDSDLWGSGDDESGPSERDKSMAIARLAAESSGADYYDSLEAMEQADDAEYREFGDGID